MAILALALGIGATTAVFKVVYGVLLKPLAFDEPDRLVVLEHLAPGFHTSKLPQSAAAIALFATYLPARRASTIDAIVVLRCARP